MNLVQNHVLLRGNQRGHPLPKAWIHNESEQLLREMQGKDLEKLQRARLKGLKKELRQACDRVDEEIEQRLDCGNGRWQWQSPDGTFLDYEPDVSQAIEAHISSGTAEPLIVQNGGVGLRIHFKPTTEQEVVGGGGKRRCLRSVEPNNPQKPSWTPQRLFQRMTFDACINVKGASTLNAS